MPKKFFIFLMLLQLAGCQSFYDACRKSKTRHQERCLTSDAAVRAGEVGVVAWPGAVSKIQIPPAGLTLAEALRSGEGAIHSTYLAIAQASLNESNLATRTAMVVALHNDSNTGESLSDVICLQRGSTIYVFPRELFLNAATGRVRLLPNDVVFSAPLAALPPFASSNGSGVQRFLLTGPLALQPRTITSDEAEGFFALERLDGINPPLGSYSPIGLIIIERRSEGRTYRLMLPHRYSEESGVVRPIDGSDDVLKSDPLFYIYKDNLPFRENDVVVLTRFDWTMRALAEADGASMIPSEIPHHTDLGPSKRLRTPPCLTHHARGTLCHEKHQRTR